jgi:broad specificity phosphatase PhoE
MRTSWTSKSWGILLLVLATLLPQPGSVGASSARALSSTETQAATTVFLVRHAEKAEEGDPSFDPQRPADPPLSAAGQARAEALARTLEEAGVTAIFASEFARTGQTVAPLAARVGIEVSVHPARDVAGLVDLIATAHRGGVIVIAGHSNTVPALVEALGGGAVAPIEEGWEYDNLYVVSIGATGGALVSTLKYGAASSPQ